MKIFTTDNLLYKIVSIILAVLLWLYVNHQQNPVTEQIYNVPLETRELGQNLTISELPSYVKVRIQGQRKILENITARDLNAFLDMDGIDVGQHLVEVHVSVPEKTQLVSVAPSSINLIVEVVTTAQFPVNVSYSDNTPAMGYLALKPVLTPSQVLLSGPEDKLKQVEQVYVEVNLGDYNFNYHQKLPVKVEDDKGNLLLDWIHVTPSQIDVLIPVVRELPSKTVPVKVQLKGTPAEGYQVERLVTEPELLTVMGDVSVINKVENLTTAPLNITGAKDDVVRKLSVVLPKGLTLEGDSHVTAVVRIEKIVEKTFSGLPVSVRNVSGKLSPELSVPSVDLQVKGGESVIEKMMAADAEVYVDLSSLTAGEHQVPVKINLPSGVSLVEVNPKNITVLLK